MDLIHANHSMEDIEVLMEYSLDIAIGSDENDFELIVNSDSTYSAGDYLYIEGTEYGGIIDSISVKSELGEIKYNGRCWTGIIDKKVIQPSSGYDYYTATGDANTVLSTIINRLGLSSLFKASTSSSGINVQSYQFARYITGYKGIKQMLDSVNAKLKVSYDSGMVVLSAEPVVDYTQSEQFDSDQVALDIKKVYSGINHLICLGKGELKDRQVVHLYADADGTISQTQSITGIDELVDVYDYSNVESLEDLQTEGIKHFRELIDASEVKMSFDAEDNVYDIGDIVGSVDIVTGIEVSSKISKKIVTINNDEINIEYEVE